MEYWPHILALLGFLFGAYQWYESNKKESMNQRLEGMQESHDKDIKNLDTSRIETNTNAQALEKRVRKLESIQITEQKVHLLLKERTDPIEEAVEKLKDDIQRYHREISIEVQAAHRETNQTLTKLTENIAFLAGVVKARREDDTI